MRHMYETEDALTERRPLCTVLSHHPCCDCCMVKGRQHTLPCPICHPASVELAQRARAWNEGADFVARHPDMSAEYVRAANPYREALDGGAES